MTLSKLPLVIALLITAPLLAQNQSPEDNTSNSTVRITTHAVLLDVVVTDRNGNPVTGLTQDAFSVAEKGKPQTISFFEEHKTLQSAAPIQLPTLPLNVFTNFTPIAPPAAVNVLLLDSLNTPIESVFSRWLEAQEDRWGAFEDGASYRPESGCWPKGRASFGHEQDAAGECRMP